MVKRFSKSKNIFLILSVASLALARPAIPVVSVAVNEDGSSVSVKHLGDEHCLYTETEDGFLVTGNGAGSYVYVDESGLVTGVIARNKEERTEKEKAFLEKLDQETVRARYRELNGDRFLDSAGAAKGFSRMSHIPLMAYNQNGTPVPEYRPQPLDWTVGTQYFPVLLVGTTDKPHGDSAAFDAFLNQEGYSQGGNIGSLRDYFLFSSGGLFEPHFDIYPVDINASLTSFGTGDNFSEGRLIVEGIKILTARADFKEKAPQYCQNGNNINGFIFLFPGKEEEALEQSSKFWSHKYEMRYNGSVSYADAYESGGYKFGQYVFMSQYVDDSGRAKMNLMGSLAHEFSHMMGLKDHYVKINGVQHNGPGHFDLMSTGLYNGKNYGDGTHPPAYSSFEKETMGWLSMEELETSQVYSLKKLSAMEAYSVTNPNWNDEYYIIEYRPSEKYDEKLPRNGVLVWYIDYDEKIYYRDNAINGDLNHPRIFIKDTLTRRDYHVDFSFVNGGGVSPVTGIYNVVREENRRACFTTDKDISLSQCPEESSSSAESSNSEGSSSSEAYAQVSSSSENGGMDLSGSSSASEKIVEGRRSLAQVNVHFEGRVLRIDNPAAAPVNVKLFDLQGHLLSQRTFSETSVTFAMENYAVGHYVLWIQTAGYSFKKRI